MNEKLLIVDETSILNRAFYAIKGACDAHQLGGYTHQCCLWIHQHPE